MIVESVRVSRRAKDHLIALKRQTGIENWNVLCRWALAVSLNEQSVPSKEVTTPDSNVEMAWRTFAGPNDDVITAAVKARCIRDGFPTDEQSVAAQFKLHLHRGIRYLFANKKINSIAEFVALVSTEDE